MKLPSYGKWKTSLSALADSYLAAGESAKAAALLARLVTVNPSELEARKRFVSALLAANDLDRAKREGLFLSLLYLAEKKPEKADDVLSELSPHFPDDLNLILMAAKRLLASGNEAEAAALFNQAAERYLDANVPLGAVGLYETLSKLNPKAYDYREKIAAIYHREGILDKAIHEYFRLSEQLIDEKETEKAAEILETILSIDPANDRAPFELAETYLKVKKIAEATALMRGQIDNRIAKEKIDDAIAVSDRFIQLLSKKKYLEEANEERENLASILLARGREADGVRLLELVAEGAEAAGNLDKYLSVLQRQLHFFRKIGDTERIFGLYKKMILASTADSGLIKAIADEMIRDYADKELKELDGSLRSIAKTLKEKNFASEADEILLALGDFYASKKKTGEAVKIYRNISKAALRLADLYVEEGEIEKAIPLYKKSIEHCDSKNDLNGAVQIFNRAKQSDPKDAALAVLMGEIYFRRADWDAALNYYNEAMKLEPKSREAVIGAAMTYAKKGMLKEIARLAEELSDKALVLQIVEEYRKALSTTASPSKAGMALGRLLFDLGHYDEAVKEFSKAESDPELFVEAVHQAGLSYKSIGQNDAAIREFKKILDDRSLSDDETLDARYQLGVIYEEMGKRSEASDIYQDILVTDIGYKDVNLRLRNLAAASKNKKIVQLPKREKL